MISILIPTKNEPLIQDLVNEINKEVKQKHEIIIIDKSLVKPRVKGAKIIRQKSDSLGNAIVEGFKVSKGNIVVTMDGDGSHDPKDIPKLIEKIPEYDIAIGSKFAPGGKTEDSFSRLIVTKSTNFITRLILGVKIKDPMTGFMAVRREILDNINLRPKGYKIVLEIIYKSKSKVIEVPITFHKRKAGETKVGFNIKGAKEFFRIINLLFELRFGGRR